jgi:hypothetical protein
MITPGVTRYYKMTAIMLLLNAAGLAWLDDAMTMELEASEEMLRSCRQKLHQETAAKESAQAQVAECKTDIANKQDENTALKWRFSKSQLFSDFKCHHFVSPFGILWKKT